MSDHTRLSKRLAFLKTHAPEPPPAAPALSIPGWEKRGEFLYTRRMRFDAEAVEPWPEGVVPEACPPEGLVFFDTETTGLSGGAGTLIFLLGTAWCEGGDLVLEQMFLSDFPGEAELLEAVKERLSKFSTFVSYNGKAFDSRLLSSRFIMHRMPFRIGRQIDLLHMARRLWRPVIGDCSLHSVETGILRVERDVDVPGEEIPGIYLDYLYSGRLGQLPVVFQHNLTDVRSLAMIWNAFGRFFQGDLEGFPVDERALGAMLLDRDSEACETGATILRDAMARGKVEAGIPLSMKMKRLGRWEEAAEIWARMVETGRSMFAALELAKYHEHRLHDPARALETVEALLSWNLPLDREARAEVYKRKARLEKKAKK